MRAVNLGLVLSAMVVMQGCAIQDDPDLASALSAATVVPAFDHVVVVVMENKAYSQIKNSSSAPYINSLMAQGASFTNSHAVTHPSEPNYIALFSGSTQGVNNDNCPLSFNQPNLGRQLLDAGFTIAAYSEDLPSVGFTGCTSAKYARKHAPWTNFTNFPHNRELPFSAFPNSDFAALPTVSFVVPNLCNDMHDCSIGTGDGWLQSHINAYAQWAKTHNSLLILTWDEDDNSASNQIVTVFVGAKVLPGNYGESVNHYSILHTIESMYGLTALGTAAAPITDVWTSIAPGDDFSTGLSPATLTVAQGVSATTTLSTGVTRGNPQTVSLSATGAPSGAIVSFSSTSITTGTSATVTVATAASTVPGTYTVTLTATGAGATHTASLSVTVTGPPGAAFGDGFDSPWTTYGGAWLVSNGSYGVDAGPGHKSIANGTNYSDLLLEADVMISGGDAGLIFRGSNFAVGADALAGYYAGLGAGGVSLGKMNGNWAPLATSPMTIAASTWYHMKVVAVGTLIQVYVTDMNTPKISFTDSSHVSGAIGLRTYNSAARFDNITARSQP